MEEINLSFFTDIIIACVDNHKESTKRPLELGSDDSTVTGYKVSIIKVRYFPHVSNEQLYYEI
jgi:hypothetical protein